jgi:tRNA (guanosine-2'-O-)-methyltransferase
MPRSERRLKRIRDVLSRRQPGLTVVLENIHDPHNVSAILRSCDAVGVLGVELLYTVEPFPRIGKKSSSSANKWIRRRNHRSAAECMRTLHDEGFTVLATRVDSEATSLYDLNLTGKVAFVFGNEHRGVSDETAQLSDVHVRIPMMGMIESLNVSVAAAVCVYESLRQRMDRGLLSRPTLDEQQLETLFQEWIAR